MLGKTLITGLAVAGVFGAAQAQAAILIDATTNNGSFELAGGVANTDKIPEWDGTPDVDNWTVWSEQSTAANDSGVENTGNASDGTMVAFMQPGNAVYNMTTHVVAEGDIFNFSWDHVLRADREHTTSLVYDDGGTITSIAASAVTSDAANGVVFTYSGSYTVLAGDPAIGSTIGLGIVSPGSYPEIDNFNLEIVPEPGSIALLSLGGLLVARRRRRG